ncbi:YidC/Oxa1 family membrane protein insertase [Candidatus Contubernalis alkaliaceticus]|uniref:YidC/Oxa1 family membrane protein insertase n=1 Tax=Candidatus Contubernalis alkaliaceticus TaxID=338645 RepID=UPI001F4C1678|nr:YidC/Oxa1 family membrane protein insertase [Candidatus Contubernalis alkalaceticus]UNC93730.1 YidC/Oxa1 family membrane protein insertase [Candidatus Contubernalis alkalaceticus]
MIQSIVEILFEVLLYFYELTGNYGVAIIILTIIVKVITFPLTNKQLQSTKAIQEIQPEIKKLQEKYKNDKEKLNEETMKLWKENKINPLAGCLPLIVQFPVLIAMFRLLQDTEALFLSKGIMEFDKMFLIFDMTQRDTTFILPILAGVSTFLQQRLMTTDQSQKAMLYMMPIMLFAFSISLPAGLAMYWVLQNLLSVGQHMLINKPVLKGALKKNENS